MGLVQLYLRKNIIKSSGTGCIAVSIYGWKVDCKSLIKQVPEKTFHVQTRGGGWEGLRDLDNVQNFEVFFEGFPNSVRLNYPTGTELGKNYPLIKSRGCLSVSEVWKVTGRCLGGF